jgi:hypothetical protein
MIRPFALRSALGLFLLTGCAQPTTGGSVSGTGGSSGGGRGVPSGTGGETAASGAASRPATGAGGTGVAGSAGTTGSAGAGAAGTGGSATCAITAQSSLSTAIPTVGIVTWSTTLGNVTSAEIDFGLASTGPTMAAPVDLTQPSYRTLLLGMKGSSSYLFHIVVNSSGGSCTSPDYTITTGAVPSNVPKQTVTMSNAAAHDKGFIVTSSGLTGKLAYILDADGAPVWWATAPSEPSRVHMSWDGTKMYMMALNVQNANVGNIQSVAMDGTGTQTLSGFTTSHHDLTAIPGGLATMLWNKSGTDAPCSLVERADSTGTITTVVADLGSVYNSSTFHSNSIHYYPSDDTYTVGDRNPSLYVKLTRAGALVWQFGGSNPKDQSKFFTNVPVWSVNHGHQLLADGTFLFFNNTPNEAWEYQLDTATMTASKTLTYTASGASSTVLGDVQRLPNGNILVTFSTSGQIHEIDPSGKLVMKIAASSYGYSEFRESLYGPPPY